MKKIDINVDIGEGFFYDQELLDFATSANICCGDHAGSWDLTLTTIDLCRRRGKRIGAHPGYPDREHMGRRSIKHAGSRQKDWLQRVVESVERFGTVYPPDYIKPHGGLYNDAAVFGRSAGLGNQGATLNMARRQNWALLSMAAHALQAMVRPFTPLMGLPGTAHERIAELEGTEFIREGFADRRYQSNGLLVPRSEEDAVLEYPEEIRRQLLELAPKVDSICIHGDTPNCLELAELVLSTLRDGGYEVGH